MFAPMTKASCVMHYSMVRHMVNEVYMKGANSVFEVLAEYNRPVGEGWPKFTSFIMLDLLK